MADAEIELALITKAEKDGQGPPCYMIIEWSRATKEMFVKGAPPKQGRRYCFKCVRYDGHKSYFALEQL